MTTLEIVFVGLCAIVVDREFDCSNDTTEGDHPATPMDVVMIDPGAPHGHTAMLWVRVDGLVQAPNQCWTDGSRHLAPITDCATAPDTKWARFDMAGRELLILQQSADNAQIKMGHRNVGGDCWSGMAPGLPGSCKGDKTTCEKDVSWLFEYSKAAGPVSVNRKPIEAPHEFPWVGGIVRGLRGLLEAMPQSRRTWADSWSWDWSYASCLSSTPMYKQRFSPSAVVSNIVSVSNTVFLVPIGKREVPAPITLKEQAMLEIWNLPSDPDPATLPDWGNLGPMKVGNKCYFPHFDALSLMLEEAPLCRRTPYLPQPTGSDCTAGQGPTNPFCSVMIIP